MYFFIIVIIQQMALTRHKSTEIIALNQYLTICLYL